MSWGWRVGRGSDNSSIDAGPDSRTVTLPKRSSRGAEFRRRVLRYSWDSTRVHPRTGDQACWTRRGRARGRVVGGGRSNGPQLAGGWGSTSPAESGQVPFGHRRRGDHPAPYPGGAHRGGDRRAVGMQPQPRLRAACPPGASIGALRPPGGASVRPHGSSDTCTGTVG